MRITFVIFMLLVTGASHAELTIFDTRKNLPLSNTEKVYHDYYVDSGSESGLKQGMTLTVSRRVPMYDFYRSRSVGDLHLKVAKVKVIQVQEGLAVVRLREEISREDSPLTDDEFIMIGDRLDMGTVVADNAPATPAAEEVAVAPAATPAPAARIIVNSVDLSIDPPKQERAPASVAVPAAIAAPAIK